MFIVIIWSTDMIQPMAGANGQIFPTKEDAYAYIDSDIFEKSLSDMYRPHSDFYVKELK